MNYIGRYFKDIGNELEDGFYYYQIIDQRNDEVAGEEVLEYKMLGDKDYLFLTNEILKSKFEEDLKSKDESFRTVEISEEEYKKGGG